MNSAFVCCVSCSLNVHNICIVQTTFLMKHHKTMLFVYHSDWKYSLYFLLILQILSVSYINRCIRTDFDNFHFRNISDKTTSPFFFWLNQNLILFWFFFFFWILYLHIDWFLISFYSETFQDKWSVVQYCGTYRWYSIALSQCALSCSSESLLIYAEKFSIHTTNQNMNQIHQMIQHTQINASFIFFW